MARNTNGTGFSLKDELFNQNKVVYLGSLFQAADSRFDAPGFQRAIMRQLMQLELKQRIVYIAATLEQFLDRDFRIAARQIQAALPPPLDASKSDDDFGDFIFAPLGEYVVRNGLAARHLKLSLRTLKALTQRFSMEDAIRAFLTAHPQATLAELEKWARDKHYHVRRLVSEGTRPRLPWSRRLTLELTTPLPLLDILHADRTRYVTRSVANHLNDVAKTHPQLVMQRLVAWKQAGVQCPEELAWMTKHALRTLVKQGDGEALKLLGFDSQPRISVSDFRLEQTTLAPGQTLEFAFTLSAQRDEALLIDYVIDFVKANGRRSPKVHKLKQVSLSKGDSLTIAKRHPLRKNATTYTLYPGTHQVTLQINGQAFDSLSFEMTA
ncbi:MAG: hypothetical protein KDA45_12335 [Planctomycetales bacterium]|nr:hypothetical protein [Planctomycetales bacterium]